MSNIFSVIMAGGNGTRLWPESTSRKPKQYLSFQNGKSLIANSIDRIMSTVKRENIYIVTSDKQREIALSETSKYLNPDHIIFEPFAKNTAACILLSLAKLESNGALDEDIVIFLPSDHLIQDIDGFTNTCKKAIEVSLNTNTITTLGIRPTSAHTGYGYIKTSNPIRNGFMVNSFVEKPDKDKAIAYLNSGNYFWNAGIFISQIKTLKHEFRLHCNEMFTYYEKLLCSIQKKNTILLNEIYSCLREVSIDYAILEKSNNIALVPAEFDWNDLGSWDALEDLFEKNGCNSLSPQVDNSFFDNAKNNVVFSNKKFVAVLGLSDFAIIENKDVLMIIPKSETQRVREVTEYLKQNNLSELL